MADNITTLASRLEPILRRKLKPGSTTIIKQYITQTGGGGGGSGISDHGSLSGLADDDHLHYHTDARGDARYVPLARTVSTTAPLAGGGALSGNLTLSLTLNSTGALENSSGLRVKLPTNSGLTRDGTGLYLAPGTVTHNTTNSVSGANHYHAVDASDNVGTSPAASILKSTGAGGLTLKILDVLGDTTVNGGDFRVQGTGTYAGTNAIWVDASQGNVVMGGSVGTPPDPQFTLDIYGPVRAQYFIGPHAIQLKNVLLLAQYDGRTPFHTNFYGESNGHMGQIATTAGGLYYRKGKFGKAAVIGEGTTNYINNPSFATNTTDWTLVQTGTGASLSRYSYLLLSDGEEAGLVGSYCGLLTPSSGGTATARADSFVSVPNGGSVTVSCMVRKTDAAMTGSIGVWDTTNTTLAATAFSTLTTDGWQHIACTWQNATGSAVSVRFRAANAGSVNLLFTNCQMELKTAPTPYCDGTLPGHTWAGTAHNSNSSRGATRLAYPTAGNINVNRGTVMGWMYVHDATTTSTMLRMDGTTAGLIALRITGGQGNAFWGTGSGISGGAITPNTWVHLAMTKTGSTLRLYVNGSLVASAAETGFDGTPALMDIGRSAAGGNFANGMIDSFCIVDRVLPDNEVRAVYESDAPVFAETSRYAFRATPRNLIWADDDGFWMRDHTGNAMMAMYGGETVNYSWGGMLLNTGDVLIGNSTSYMMWDASLSTLSVKGAIEVIGTIPNASIAGLGALALLNSTVLGTTTTGTLDNVSDGSSYARVNSTLISGGNIRVGSGTKDSNLNGWHIGSTEIVGQLAGADQTVLNTSGQVAAGAGNVILDASGITVKETTRNTAWVNFYRAQGAGTLPTAMLHAYNQTYWTGVPDTKWPGVALSLTNDAGTRIGSLAMYAFRNTSGVFSDVRALAVADWFTVLKPAGEESYSPRLSMAANSGEALIITDQTTLALEAASVRVRGTLTVGTSADSIARIRPSGSNTLADSAVLNIGTGTGFLFVQNSTDGYGALYYLRATTSVELLDSHGTFSTTKDTASMINIYSESGTWRVQNKRGASKSVHVIWLGLATDF